MEEMKILGLDIIKSHVRALNLRLSSARHSRIHT